MKRPFALFSALMLYAVVCVVSIGAQSNQLVDRLLDEKQATVGDAASLILAAGQVVPEDAQEDQVMAAAREKKLLSANKKATDPITLGETSFLIMKSLGMRGGLFYMMFPGPRYAARELSYLHMVKGLSHPWRTVSGQEVIQMVGAALERKGGEQ